MVAVKQSDDLTAALAAARNNRASALNKQLWNNAGSLALIGAGTGAGLRGLQGLYNLIRRNSAPSRQELYGPLTLNVPVPVEEEEKTAGTLGDIASGDLFKNLMTGDYASNIQGHPLYAPAMLTAGGSGVYGGWKLMDWLLDKRRKAEMAAEVADAEKDYEEALLGQYKTGSLGEELDGLCDDIEKQAGWGDAAGGLLGAYLTMAGAGALGTGMLAYNIASKRRRKALLEKARRQQLRGLRSLSPATLYVNPVPQRNRLTTAPTEDEMDGEPLDKVAKDLIPGGKADNKPNSKYPAKQIAMGRKVEMEHVNDSARAKEIAKDHLEEFDDYYTRLHKMEERAKKEKKANKGLLRLPPPARPAQSVIAGAEGQKGASRAPAAASLSPTFRPQPKQKLQPTGA